MAALVAIHVRGRARELVGRATRQALRRKISRVLRAAGRESWELSLSLVDDAEIRALNHEYAGQDHATDVLSFSQREGVLPSRATAIELLGDVVISAETALRQADAAGRPLGDELLHLAVHGVAHLLGFDHRNRAEERRMFAFEARLREQAAGTGPVALVLS